MTIWSYPLHCRPTARTLGPWIPRSLGRSAEPSDHFAPATERSSDQAFFFHRPWKRHAHRCYLQNKLRIWSEYHNNLAIHGGQGNHFMHRNNNYTFFVFILLKSQTPVQRKHIKIDAAETKNLSRYQNSTLRSPTCATASSFRLWIYIYIY